MRPVTVTLQDDSTCTSGAEQFEQAYGKTRVRKCGCQIGFYIVSQDELFCHSAVECLPCPAGMECGFDQDHTQATISKHYYRAENTSLSVVECPIAQACIGKNIAGDALCREGHQGPFCMLCEINSTDRYEVGDGVEHSCDDDKCVILIKLHALRFVWSDEKCVKCSPASEASVYAVVFLLGLLCVGCVCFIAKTAAKKKMSGRKSRFDTERLEAFAGKIQTKYKILVTFMQVV